MIILDNENTFPLEHTLFVFAMEAEAGEAFENHNKVFTGLGKVNAAFELARAIHRQRPRLIVNMGSAGSNHFRQGEVVCCTRFVQRDMDVRGLGFALYETPFSGVPPVLAYGLKREGLPEGICGTGDSFEMNHAVTEYNVVDMEAYALALIAMKEGIPFLCLKYISDGADGSAAADWAVQVHQAAEAYSALLLPKGGRL
jgi:adenosylhomocysteine nucleosidase